LLEHQPKLRCQSNGDEPLESIARLECTSKRSCDPTPVENVKSWPLTETSCNLTSDKAAAKNHSSGSVAGPERTSQSRNGRELDQGGVRRMRKLASPARLVAPATYSSQTACACPASSLDKLRSDTAGGSPASPLIAQYLAPHLTSDPSSAQASKQARQQAPGRVLIDLSHFLMQRAPASHKLGMLSGPLHGR